MCPVIDFIQRSIVFINVCLPNFDYFSLNISVCTETEHQGNRYPAARNSASPPETFTHWLNTPGTVTILQGVAGVTPVLVAVAEDLGINLVPLSITGIKVHHGRVGSAGLCDLKILHPWRRLKKGVKILQWPPNARKGGSIFYISMKSLQKKGVKNLQF